MTPAFRGGAIHVRTPATSANLGPGYDSLGLALALYDDVVARIGESGLQVDVAGAGIDLARDETHLVVRSMRATFDRLGGQPRGLELSCANRIPHGRGLGSSAAAIVAGVLLARGLVLGADDALPDPAAFALAAELEGHPDNVAACFFGGLTIAWAAEGTTHAISIEVVAPIRPVVFIAPFESSTATARGALPASVPHADAAFQAGRSALLVAVLAGRAPLEALLAATEDRLHQQYRAAVTAPSAELVTTLRALGHPAVVSGAGPTVLVLARDDLEVERIRALTPHGWHCDALDVDALGARIVPSSS